VADIALVVIEQEDNVLKPINDEKFVSFLQMASTQVAWGGHTFAADPAPTAMSAEPDPVPESPVIQSRRATKSFMIAHQEFLSNIAFLHATNPEMSSEVLMAASMDFVQRELDGMVAPQTFEEA
jgi:hypothetical protein